MHKHATIAGAILFTWEIFIYYYSSKRGHFFTVIAGVAAGKVEKC
jgi:hypothetical protein